MGTAIALSIHRLPSRVIQIDIALGSVTMSPAGDRPLISRAISSKVSSVLRDGAGP